MNWNLKDGNKSLYKLSLLTEGLGIILYISHFHLIHINGVI